MLVEKEDSAAWCLTIPSRPCLDDINVIWRCRIHSSHACLLNQRPISPCTCPVLLYPPLYVVPKSTPTIKRSWTGLALVGPLAATPKLELVFNAIGMFPMRENELFTLFFLSIPSYASYMVVCDNGRYMGRGTGERVGGFAESDV